MSVEHSDLNSKTFLFHYLRRAGQRRRRKFKRPMTFWQDPKSLTILIIKLLLFSCGRQTAKLD